MHSHAKLSFCVHMMALSQTVSNSLYIFNSKIFKLFNYYNLSFEKVFIRGRQEGFEVCGVRGYW